jgi:hypothetical protein
MKDRTKQTPGPWTVEDPFDGKVQGPAIWANGILIGQVAGLAPFDFTNARLIAAAPDLLTACEVASMQIRRFVETVERMSHLDLNTGEMIWVAHVLSIAIVKAKGGAA